MTRPVALLDGDIIAHRAAAALQQAIDWDGDGEVHHVTNAEEAAKAAQATADAWAALAGCKEAIVAFTGGNNFRKVVMPSYKSNRKGVAKPLAFAYAVRSVRDRFPHHVIDGLEADDVMGILATTLPKYAGAVMVTTDKDLRTVPGLHLNPMKDKKPVLVTPEEADYLWMMQTLTGDSTDGYSGIPKVGPKRAEAILGGPGRSLEALWDRVVHAYRKAGLTDQDALTTARVARILRREDYDKKTKEIRLWHPTTPESYSLVTGSSASTTSPSTPVSSP